MRAAWSIKEICSNKSQRIKPTASTPACRTRRRRYSETSLDVEEICNGQNLSRSVRLDPFSTVICLDMIQSNNAVKEDPCQLHLLHQAMKTLLNGANKLVVTVQIDNTPRKRKRIQCKTELPNGAWRNSASYGGKTEQSKSLSEFYILKVQQNAKPGEPIRFQRD